MAVAVAVLCVSVFNNPPFYNIIQRYLSCFRFKISYFINTGQKLQDLQDFGKLNRILKSENIKEIWDENELSLGAILKMLVLLLERYIIMIIQRCSKL